MAGPLITRLALTGGATTARAVSLLADPAAVSGTFAWVASLTASHAEALKLQVSFSGQELHTISLVAPRGNIIQYDGDPTSTNLTLIPARLDVEVTPALAEAARAPKEVRFVAARLRRLHDW